MLVLGSVFAVFALFDPPQMGNLMIPGQSVFFVGVKTKTAQWSQEKGPFQLQGFFLGNMMERCSESVVLVFIIEKQQICVKYFRFNLHACIGDTFNIVRIIHIY